MAKNREGLVPENMRTPAGEDDTFATNCATLAFTDREGELVTTGKAEEGVSIETANSMELKEGTIIVAHDGGKPAKGEQSNRDNNER